MSSKRVEKFAIRRKADLRLAREKRQARRHSALIRQAATWRMEALDDPARTTADA